MNKRQRKKKWKRETPEEFQICQECGHKLDWFDSWQMRYGTCTVSCYRRLVCAEGY